MWHVLSSVHQLQVLGCARHTHFASCFFRLILVYSYKNVRSGNIIVISPATLSCPSSHYLVPLSIVSTELSCYRLFSSYSHISIDIGPSSNSALVDGLGALLPPSSGYVVCIVFSCSGASGDPNVWFLLFLPNMFEMMRGLDVKKGEFRFTG